MLLAAPQAVDPQRLEAGETLPLKNGARIGTSAARRQAQVARLRPDLQILDLRGNVPTRIQRLRDGRYDAILLARAGLVRLGLSLDGLFARPLDVAAFVPAPAQGMLGIQCRDEEPYRTALARLHCPAAARTVALERELLLRLEGGCQIPFGVNLAPEGGLWRPGSLPGQGRPGPCPLAAVPDRRRSPGLGRGSLAPNPRPSGRMTPAPRIILTRRQGRNEPWAAVLQHAGLDCLCLPLIRCVTLAPAADLATDLRAGGFDWILFTSPQAVEVFRRRGWSRTWGSAAASWELWATAPRPPWSPWD